MNASETGTPETVCTTNSAHGQRYIPMLVWLISIMAIIAVPFGILRHGYLPYADGLRHAAKPLADKAWSEILVLDDWVTLDHNPGWHVLLGAVHQLTGWGPDGLVAFSLLFLIGGFCLMPLIWVRRPEAWLAVLLIMGLAMQT